MWSIYEYAGKSLARCLWKVKEEVRDGERVVLLTEKYLYKQLKFKGFILFKSLIRCMFEAMKLLCSCSISHNNINNSTIMIDQDDPQRFLGI